MKFQPSKLEPVWVNIDGVEYPAKMTMGGLAELEELTGMGFLKLFNKFADQEMAASDLINILYVMLKCGGVELCKKDINDVYFTAGILDAMSQVLNRALKVNSVLQDHKEKDNKKKMN